MGQLTQRVGLVHDLGQLAAAEEVVDRCADGLAVYQAAGGEPLRVFQVDAVLHCALHLQEALAQLLAGQLPDGAHPAVAQVVNVVHLSLAFAHGGYVADGAYQVLRPQALLFDGHVRAELAVHAEPAHRPELIAVRVEELLEDGLLGLLQGEGRSRPQLAVELLDSALVVVAAVLGQSVQNQGIEVLRQDVQLLQPRLGQLLSGLLGDGLARLDEHRLFLFVELHRHGADPLAQLGAGRALGELDGLHVVEQLQQLLVGGVFLVQRTHQEGGRLLAAAVELTDQVVPPVDLHLDPASPLGDDPAGVEHAVAHHLAGEVAARRAVQLADDDPFGPVDDELPAPEHDGHLAQVNVLLQDLVRLVQSDAHVERAPVGEPQLQALLGQVPGLAQPVFDQLQPDALRLIDDGEGLVEYPLQAGVLPLLGRDVSLEELRVRIPLDAGQVRDVYRAAQFGEVTDFHGSTAPRDEG